MRAAVHRELRPGTGKGASAGAGPPRRAAPHGRLWAAPGPRVVVARLLLILVVASVMMLVRFDTEQRVADFSPVVNLASMRATVRRVHWLVVHKVLKMRVNKRTHLVLYTLLRVYLRMPRKFVREAAIAVAIIVLQSFSPIGPVAA